MVAPLSQIQKELVSLNQKAYSLRDDLAKAYRSYLNVLAESAQSQMILACFGLCTERHAAQFLALSLTQRQTLQQDLQKLGIDLGEKLIQAGKDLLPDVSDESQTPMTVVQSVLDLEQLLMTRLRTSSLAINRLLEKYNILKIKSLEALFEIAAKAEEAGRPITNPPLLLKAIVDLKDEEEESAQPLTAIYLQLGDLEFADPKLTTLRQPIRQTTQTLMSLQKNYQAKKEEETMAEAIAAWRASWYPYSLDS